MVMIFLTSQLFGNVFLNELDHFVKRDLGISYYGRYVDDFVLIHPNKEYLKFLIPVIREYLAEKLQLQLHPDKIYLQHHSKGVNYLGVVIKPYRNYIGNRTKKNFYNTVDKWNHLLWTGQISGREDMEVFRSSMNSYLGSLKHYNTYKLRRKIVSERLAKEYHQYLGIEDDF
ncbi:MAG: RNA-directed DNA polymerase [Bacteroidota bacterium]